MKRVRRGSVVHFRLADGSALCGNAPLERDLFGRVVSDTTPTSDRVDCPDCARVYCQVKNSPWNEVEAETLLRATYDAVKES